MGIINRIYGYFGIAKIKPVKESFDLETYSRIKEMIKEANSPTKLNNVMDFIKQVGRYSPNVAVAAMMELKLMEFETEKQLEKIKQL